MGEYERTATTVFNAYIGPRISAYLNNLERVLREKIFETEAADHAGIRRGSERWRYLRQRRRHDRVGPRPAWWAANTSAD